MKHRFTISLYGASRYRLLLYGFAALWILYVHMLFTPPEGPLKAPLLWLKMNGGCGVTLFAMLSGMGLYRSLSRNPNVLAFYKRRLLRLLPTSLIVAIVFMGFQPGGSLDYLSSITFVSYWLGADTLWYVPYMMLMYLIYPALYALQRRSPWLLWIPMALSVGFAFAAPVLFPGWAEACKLGIQHTPAFILGCILTPAVEKHRRVPVWILPLLLVAYAWAFSLYPKVGVHREFALCVSYLFLAPLVILLLIPLSKFLSRGRIRHGFYRLLAYMGTFSLEIYLLYSRLLSMLRRLPDFVAGRISDDKLNALCVLLTLMLAPMLRYLCQMLIDHFRNTPVPWRSNAEGL